MKVRIISRLVRLMKIELNYHDKQRSFVLFLLNETLNIVFAHYGSQTLTN
jgi:hypothetical protein